MLGRRGSAYFLPFSTMNPRLHEDSHLAQIGSSLQTSVDKWSETIFIFRHSVAQAQHIKLRRSKSFSSSTTWYSALCAAHCLNQQCIPLPKAEFHTVLYSYFPAIWKALQEYLVLLPVYPYFSQNGTVRKGWFNDSLQFQCSNHCLKSCFFSFHEIYVWCMLKGHAKRLLRVPWSALSWEHLIIL